MTQTRFALLPVACFYFRVIFVLFTTNTKENVMTYAQRRKFLIRNIRELRFMRAQTYLHSTRAADYLLHTQLARFRRDLVALRQGR